MPDDAELLATRLARMKVLIEELEKACAENEKHKLTFLRLLAELDAVRRGLTTRTDDGSSHTP